MRTAGPILAMWFTGQRVAASGLPHYWSTEHMRDTDLLATEFEPLQWSIHELLPEGGILLGGPEKGGKSWLLLGEFAVSVATGRAAFDRFPVEQGDVLYLGWEDSRRRLQERLQAILYAKGMDSASGHLHLYGKGEWPEGDEGGYKKLEEWLSDFPNARLAIIDPVSDFDPVPTTYKAGRAYMNRFVSVGERHHVSMVISTHTGKFATSTRGGVNRNGRSWRDAILGRAASAADVILGHFPDMSKEPVETAVLKTTGKDVHVGDIGLKFDGTLWSVQAPGDGPKTSEAISLERKLVLAILEAEGPLTAQEIADRRGQSYDSAYHLLADMRASKDIERIHGYHMTPKQAEEIRNPKPTTEAANDA